ncbi:hypothetical protein [Demequina silvatica]|uniref:hypothetical protein n=1 Tax=Demequina silvatica TaxID=1638988 RepID=UPI000A77F565|nr:hypothetical protein [Demequina silvatica]
MGAGFVLTGLLLSLTLTAAAILRWSAKPWHAVGLAAAAMATTVTIALAGALVTGPAAAGEALLTATVEEPEPDADASYFFTAYPTPPTWLTVAGDGAQGDIPWPVDTFGAVVADGVPTSVGLSEVVLAAYYETLDDVDRVGDVYFVQTRTGGEARVELVDGVLTVTLR